jgi:hypothetical protein
VYRKVRLDHLLSRLTSKGSALMQTRAQLPNLLPAVGESR